MKFTATTTVNDLPLDIVKYFNKSNGVLWITATALEGELWYYDLWFTEADAKLQAQVENKIALKVEG